MGRVETGVETDRMVETDDEWAFLRPRDDVSLRQRAGSRGWVVLTLFGLLVGVLGVLATHRPVDPPPVHAVVVAAPEPEPPVVLLETEPVAAESPLVGPLAPVDVEATQDGRGETWTITVEAPGTAGGTVTVQAVDAETGAPYTTTIALPRAATVPPAAHRS